MNLYSMVRRFLGLAIAVLCLSTGVRCFAAEKELSAELKKDYNACVFSFELENVANYNIAVISPEGESSESIVEQNNIADIAILNAKAGTWKVRVFAEELEDIGKVKLSIRASETDRERLNEKVQVGKDIEDIKVFMVDDVLNVTWNRKINDNISVRVIDVDSQKKIYEQSEDSGKLQIPIPDTTNRVTVELTPLTSYNVDDSAIRYTIDTKPNMDFKVEFDNADITNQSSCHARFDFSKKYSILIIDNEIEVISDRDKDLGSYEYEIPLVEGYNHIRAYIEDERGNRKSVDKEIVKDSISPQLSLDVDYNGVETSDNTITLSGSVKDYDTFFINETQVQPEQDGIFTYDYPLHDGENRIEFTAVDNAQNKTTYTAVVNKVEKKLSIRIGDLLKILLAVVALIVILNLKKRNGNKSNENERAE